MLIHGVSPAAVKEAHAKAGKPFDFAFVDGNHDLVEQDCKGIEPYLAFEALVLFHDAQYRVVRAAVDQWVEQHSPFTLDHGIVDKSVNVLYAPPERLGGLRAVTWRRPTESAGRYRHQPSSPNGACRLFL